ncbi:MAG: hypothetical protein LBD41_03730 [Clostridiales Family XIII bacterium]|jgi:hypothetical protein|nr:hypothetical protein [Clostridiales Family XIII bacterium]
MSLDTVLQIGKAFRNSENNLKYFKYVEACPKDKDGNWPICITIPVKSDFSFDWDNITLTPENKRDKLYYLKFKTSDSDGLVKYVFGDIYYENKGKLKKDGSVEKDEGGYYRLEDPNHSKAAYRPSSFNRGNVDYKEIIQNVENQDIIEKFHDALKENLIYIERILKYIPAFVHFIENEHNTNIIDYLDNEENLYLTTIYQNYKKRSTANLRTLGITSEFSLINSHHKKKLFDLTNASIFIHFEFFGQKHWYQFSDEMDMLNRKIFTEFIENGQHGVVLKKTLYKTLCSGDKNNDIQFPSFDVNNKYKSKEFQNNELQDLFYALDYTNKGRQIQGTDIKLIVLPRGKNLTIDDYETFLSKKDEDRIVDANQSKTQSDILFYFSSDANENITSFDLIFCKKGGQTSPDKDLIEISGIEKSKLRLIMERISKIAKEIEINRKRFFNTEKDFFPLKIDYAFREILGDPRSDTKTGKVSYYPNPKYQSHLLKILPLIYTENYHNDDVLLPAFVQNVEFSVRVGDNKYNFLKYDLKFLFSIQNNKNNKYMEITMSVSYQIGYLLGELAKNLSLEINSFEKNYVGNLTRRIGNLSDFIKLKNEIEQKLILHDKAKFTFQKSYELSQRIKEFQGTYDKEECAFGFFESYFMPIPKKEAKQNSEN